MHRQTTILILMIVCSSYSLAATYYARPSGHIYGTGDGSSYEDAFSGLPDMSQGNFGPGDILYICDSHVIDHNWEITDSGSQSQDITISGACPDHPGTIDFNDNPGAFGIYIHDNSYITLRDLTIRNSIDAHNFYGLIYLGSSKGMITANHKFINIMAIESGRNGFMVEAWAGKITDILFKNCTAQDSYRNGFAIFGRDIERVTHRNCKAIRSNQARENHQGFSCNGNPIVIPNFSELWIESQEDIWYINLTDELYDEHDVTVVYARRYTDSWTVNQDLTDGSLNGRDETNIEPEEFYWQKDSKLLWVNVGSDITPEHLNFQVKVGNAVKGCYYYDCESYGAWDNADGNADGNGFYADWFAEDVLYERCSSHDNYGPGFTSAHAKNVTIRYSIFYNNLLNSGSHTEMGSGAFIRGGSKDIKIYNSVFDGNNNLPTIRLRNSGSDITIKNNIIKDATLYSIMQNDYEGIFSNIIVDNNLIFGGDSGTYGLTPTNTIAEDPLFVDEPNRDFHLQVDSPAIDAGIDLELTHDFDLQPILNQPDIGAFEFQGEPSECGNELCEDDEDYVICPDDCFHPADVDEDGCVDMDELIQHVQCWRITLDAQAAFCTISTVVDAIDIWLEC